MFFCFRCPPLLFAFLQPCRKVNTRFAARRHVCRPPLFRGCLEKGGLSGYKSSLAMKRFTGIICCVVLLFASALWALERCQNYDSRRDAYARDDETSHALGPEFGHSHASTNEPTIHCPDTQVKLSFVSPRPFRMAHPEAAKNVVPIPFCSAVVVGVGGIVHGEPRPPGSFLSAVSPYLSLSVLRL